MTSNEKTHDALKALQERMASVSATRAEVQKLGRQLYLLYEQVLRLDGQLRDLEFMCEGAQTALHYLRTSEKGDSHAGEQP